ncbi:MAG: biopolymer transporter ExbD [Candidatus Cloacimonetes bacterium]|jgi:biopolymer transport protein ExbD|nr:biopolymer transporter ExbD [Candidatus Cloacimonadota bacterium]MDD4156573.1 biopolymer transporter ExbD [Candidatus Cloacimonadota bacterium]
MRVSVKKKAITSVALISMTDVVFLLLIFLLITSNFISFTGINIDVPTSKNAHTNINRNISLTINDNEEIYLNDILIKKENLIEALKKEIQKNPEAPVMIQADQSIALQKVIELIDAAKSAGSIKFFIAAQLIEE